MFHMGTGMPEIFFQPTSITPHPVPLEALLIDAEKAASMGDMSVSWWHVEVRAGRAPAPAIRKPRCTRWRVSEVREFWVNFAEQAADDEAAQRLVDHNKRASQKSSHKRTAMHNRIGAEQ